LSHSCSFPGCNIPTAILNPDVIPGKANQYLARYVQAICCQFESTRGYLMKNVYLMTAGFSPKYLPEQLVRYMDSRGREKVMWSSYWPIMTVERTLREGNELPLRPEAMTGYLGDNAARVFGTPDAT
jgi:predicted TIM-barrel fold metal-dependent hydrolase